MLVIWDIEHDQIVMHNVSFFLVFTLLYQELLSMHIAKGALKIIIEEIFPS